MEHYLKQDPANKVQGRRQLKEKQKGESVRVEEQTTGG